MNLRVKKYCIWHEAITHNTSECIVFRNKIQDEIDKKNIMFPDDEDVNVVGMDEPFELFCGMVEINNVFMITL